MNELERGGMAYALFVNARHLEEAFQDLIGAGFPAADISLLLSEDAFGRDFASLAWGRARDGAAAGGLVGGALGGVIGGLVAIGATFTGGIGLMVMGPAIAFAATGSIVGGLLGHGVPEDEARVLHDALHDGKAMIAVHGRTRGDLTKARAIFACHEGAAI